MMEPNRRAAVAALAAVVAGLLAPLPALAQSPANTTEFRPPAVPLVTFDPYLSIWSEADHLTDENTRHWTRREQSLRSLIRIDGKTYRLMGADPAAVPAFPQTGLRVFPTRTIYNFDNAHVHVTMTFMTAALPHDLNILSRPLSYITWQVRSVDGARHTVSIYDSASSELVVNTPDEKVDWSRARMGTLTAMRMGTVDQPILQMSGDGVRINWGYAYLAASRAQSTSAIGGDQTLLSSFVDHGALPARDDTRAPRAVSDDQPVMALVFNLGVIGAAPVSRHVMVAYDEIYAIKYFGQKLRPYWRRNGATPSTLLQSAEHDYTNVSQRCAAFDQELMADLSREGGPRYAQLAALAYRQCLAGTGLAADANKQPLLFTKENTSNGDIATVDVIFPMDPMMILFSPTLAKASLVPDLSYAASGRWRFPNAPHDLGTYPIVRGTDNGGEGMPVEESGNMIILCDAIAQEDGNARFVAPWWSKITQWAQYLEKYGLDPKNQLCTDDFMGHLAHNANLSVKAILALAAYGDLCRMRGDKADAARYTKEAKTDAAHWVRVTADGGHSRLAFDRPGTWSQKYNLVWDKILALNVFPPSVAQQEIAYYKKMMQPYGVPLDSRTHLTKTDWSLWSATLASSKADFETLVSPIYDYMDRTSSRDPLVDSYVTDNIKSDGMHARPVVGGLFIKMLADRAMWKKWSSGDRTKVGNWAPIPARPKLVVVVPTAMQRPAIWNYTTQRPPDGWTKPGFDDSQWKQGRAGFGTTGTPGAVIGTTWNTDDIWLRRTLTMPAGNHPNLVFLVYHDEDVQIFVNGVPAAGEAGFATSYVPLDITAPARAMLKPGAHVTLAVHCHQTTGGQDIDVGLASVVQKTR
ncbi:MAG TPA: DUF5127 domain-containing protein [Armatimonadota bacterium]|nr:DUF5127 domain-containing protein [Armatimonadota bacterium]